MYKTESAAQAIKKCEILYPHLFRFQLPESHLFRINSRLKIDVITQALLPSNAASLLGNYDVILDCTDNAPTRYLLSDTAVSLGKPLVSGAAEKYQGQLCTYNLGKDGLCFRCLFPKPPPPDHTASCQDGGILGAVTGVIGNLQARLTLEGKDGFHANLADGLNELLDNLAAVVGSIKSAVVQIRAGADEIARGNAALSTRTEAQSSALEQTGAEIGRASCRERV